MVCKPEPGESRRERHLAFIEANRGAFAAAARQGFQERGRGMLLVNEADFMDRPRGVWVRYRMGYVGERTPGFALADGWPGEPEATWVAGYDPGTTMLVAFVRADGGLSSYRVRFA